MMTLYSINNIITTQFKNTNFKKFKKIVLCILKKTKGEVIKYYIQ